jgi:molybdopterin-binding protein
VIVSLKLKDLLGRTRKIEIVRENPRKMAAVITTRSAQDMGLKVRGRVAALVKATDVSLRRRD